MHHLILIDVSAYVYRYYFALPPIQRPSDGQAVNAVHAYCTLLRRLSNQHPHTHIAAVFDYGRSVKRAELLPTYKANRPPAPVELTSQFALVRQATEAFGVTIAQCKGFEADDVIATYARLATEQGISATIMSSDKDMMQCVNEHVSIYDPMQERLKGRPEVFEFFGVAPERVIDVQGLMGDTSDNIPGIRGIGIKTAGKLIAEFGDLDTLIAKLAMVPSLKTREAIRAGSDQARLSKELARLDISTPVELSIEDMAVKPVDGETLLAFYRAMEFDALASKIEMEMAA